MDKSALILTLSFPELLELARRRPHYSIATVTQSIHCRSKSNEFNGMSIHGVHKIIYWSFYPDYKSLTAAPAGIVPKIAINGYWLIWPV